MDLSKFTRDELILGGVALPPGPREVVPARPCPRVFTNT
jgi:hypothetical protein